MRQSSLGIKYVLFQHSVEIPMTMSHKTERRYPPPPSRLSSPFPSPLPVDNEYANQQSF